MAKDRIHAIADQIAGKAKRLIGEIGARPDLVMRGEDQEAEAHRGDTAPERDGGRRQD